MSLVARHGRKDGGARRDGERGAADARGAQQVTKAQRGGAIRDSRGVRAIHIACGDALTQLTASYGQSIRGRQFAHTPGNRCLMRACSALHSLLLFCRSVPVAMQCAMCLRPVSARCSVKSLQTSENVCLRAPECSEAEPDCDLSDWSIPQDFCLNDCDFQYKYCADPVARWTYGPSPVTLGSCAVIKCSVVEESINGVSVSFIKGRDGSGCLSDAAYAQCQVSCEQRRQTCRAKCAACAGHCLCACQGVIDTCKDMCLVKHGVCMANNAPVVCNVTANGLEKCCDDELAVLRECVLSVVVL